MFGHDHGRRHGPFGRHGNWWDLFKQGGPQPRARRGDIRAGILALLKEGPRNGYQLMQELSERSNGMWRPSPGSVYPALQLLEDEGLVEVDASAGGKVYTLTKKGKAYVESHADEIGEPWKRGQESASGGDDMFELMTLVKQLAPAVVQVVATGTPTQLKEARKILGAARRKLYELLAQTDDDDEEDEDEEDDKHDREHDR